MNDKNHNYYKDELCWTCGGKGAYEFDFEIICGTCYMKENYMKLEDENK